MLGREALHREGERLSRIGIHGIPRLALETLHLRGDILFRLLHEAIHELFFRVLDAEAGNLLELLDLLFLELPVARLLAPQFLLPHAKFGIAALHGRLLGVEALAAPVEHLFALIHPLFELLKLLHAGFVLPLNALSFLQQFRFVGYLRFLNLLRELLRRALVDLLNPLVGIRLQPGDHLVIPALHRPHDEQHHHTNNGDGDNHCLQQNHVIHIRLLGHIFTWETTQRPPVGYHPINTDIPDVSPPGCTDKQLKRIASARQQRP